MELKNIPIEVISIKDKSAAGIAYTEKRTGRKQWRIAIKPVGVDIWIDNYVFDGDPALEWKKGQTVEILVSQTGDKYHWKPALSALEIKPTIPKKAEPNLKTPDDVIIELLKEINGKLDILTATEHNSRQ